MNTQHLYGRLYDRVFRNWSAWHDFGETENLRSAFLDAMVRALHQYPSDTLMRIELDIGDMYEYKLTQVPIPVLTHDPEF